MRKKLRNVKPHTRWQYILLLAGLLYVVPDQAIAQPPQKITIRIEQQSLVQSLRQLQEATGLVFAFDEEQLKLYHNKRHTYTNESLQTILTDLLQETGYDFKTVNGNIVISKKIATPVPARKGVVITGKITDGKTGNGLAGVSVDVQGSTVGTITNADGAFSLEVKDSAATLAVSFVGYATQIVNASGKTLLNIILKQDINALGGVMVEARKRMNTEAAILTERRNAAVVSDGISAQNIEKTASITTVQALQRVTGVTVSNDRNVAIRGLGDRNVIAQLNGARLSGANPDQNSPPLDLVPAGLLESITVYKTVTPDKPADATAGIIELKTKAVPERMMLFFTAQSGTNSTTGIVGDFTSFKGAELGSFGQNVKKHDLPAAFYNLARRFPGGMYDLQNFMLTSRSSAANTAYANSIDKMEKALPAVLMNSYRKAAPNQIYTIGFGNTFRFKGGQALGITAGLNYYKRTVEKHDGIVNQYSIFQGTPLTPKVIPPYIDPNNIRLGKFAGYNENTGNEQLNYGGLVTVTYRFNKRNEISANYLLNRGAEEGATYLDGTYQNTGSAFTIGNKAYQLTQSYRTFSTLQLKGEHKVTKGDYSPQVSWSVSGSRATELDPDNRFFSLIADSSVFAGSPFHTSAQEATYFQPLRSELPGVIPGYILAIDPNGRKFRSLKENNRNYTLDLSLPFRLGGEKQQVKLGGYYLNKDRTFAEYNLYLPDIVYAAQGSLANDLYPFYGNLNAYINPGRIGFANSYGMEGQVRSLGFLYYPQKTFNNYSGYQRVTAAYGMVDLKLYHHLRVTGGVRLEATDIRGTVDTVGASTDPMIYGYHRVINTGVRYKTGLKPYASGNITYNLNSNTNFRLAYTSTLARPELREMMPTIAFDPFQYAVVTGNTALHNQETRNLDFRWEYFPQPDEVFAASAFYKWIDGQLTREFGADAGMLHYTGPTYNLIQYVNDPEQGRVYGIELEARKGLGRLAPALHNFYAGANLLLARSVIQKNAKRLQASRMIDTYSSDKSPVFEQPPYALNTYIDYDNRKSGTNATLSFNVVGPRLVQVRTVGEPDVYDHPAPALDFVCSQKMTKQLLLKAFVKNILNPEIAQYYATPGGSYTKFAGHTYQASGYRRGVELAVGITWNVL